MSDESSLDIAKQVVELAKELASGIAPEGEKAAESSNRTTRGGPLQVVGRLYLGLTTIAALAATAAAFIDGRSSNSVGWETTGLRILVALAVFGGLAGGAWLVYFLAKRHPSLLLSPTEFTAEVHAQIMGHGEPQGTPKARQARDDDVVDDDKEAARTPTGKPKAERPVKMKKPTPRDPGA